MKELVEKIEESLDYLNDMVFILNKGFKGVRSYDEHTVKEQLDIYGDCADKIKAAMDEIAEKFGDVKLKDL